MGGTRGGVWRSGSMVWSVVASGLVCDSGGGGSFEEVVMMMV